VTRYREEVPGVDPQTAHGSRARAFAAIGSDIESLEARGASGTAYSASSSADWSGSPPATVAEALDRLAALVGPVP